MLAAVVSDDFRVIFIDEPEAFLHPTLSRKLGRRLTALAAERSANVFVATHSSDFLMGCVEAGDVDVVRLTYKRNVATSRNLPSGTLATMMNTPLLRSTGVLSGLFYEGVVVAEDDADRAFYQETARRLTEGQSESVSDALFLNAQNKQTINRIIAPLREVGIPAAAIVDLDIIKDRGFNDLLKAASVPETQLTAWNTQRSGIARAFDDASLDMKKVGVDGLPGSEKESAQNLIDTVAGYGVFIVPVGELERWFQPLTTREDFPGKSGWFAWIFDLMEKEPEVLADQRDDVWKFLRSIASWISDPERKGIPG